MESKLLSKIQDNLKKLYSALQGLSRENEFDSVKSQLLDITYGNYKTLAIEILEKTNLSSNYDISTSINALSLLISGKAKDISRIVDEECNHSTKVAEHELDPFEIQSKITTEVKQFIGDYHYTTD